MSLLWLCYAPGSARAEVLLMILLTIAPIRKYIWERWYYAYYCEIFLKVDEIAMMLSWQTAQRRLSAKLVNGHKMKISVVHIARLIPYTIGYEDRQTLLYIFLVNLQNNRRRFVSARYGLLYVDYTAASIERLLRNVH